MFAGLFLTDTGPELGEALARQARAGVRIRLLLGDPDSERVAIRGGAEGIADGLAARIRISGKYLDDAHPSCPELLIEFPHLVGRCQP